MVLLCIFFVGYRTNTEPVKDGNLTIYYYDVGQADCTLIVCDGEAMLIDAGNRNMGADLKNRIKKAGVTDFKYVVATHADSDHIGSMEAIIEKYPVEMYFMPNKDGKSKTYESLMLELKRKHIKINEPVVGTVYSLGTSNFTIVGPTHISEDDNNCSIAIRLVHGNNSFLFVGDAEHDEEYDMLNSKLMLKSDVLKVGHHGSRTSSSSKFMKAVAPQYAVISCGIDNSYGHPHAKTLNTLRTKKIDTFRTDIDGTIICKSDGESITWNVPPTNNWVSGEPKNNSQTKK